jgi:pimeloyl-ACP methyl ester carboxylesterase
MTTLGINQFAMSSTVRVDEIERPDWLPASRWPFPLRRFSYRQPDGDALHIHYTDEGSGPTLVLVHAGMWSFIWRDTIAALRDDFRCITVDFPGAGLSGGDRHAVDLTTYPAIVNSLLDRLGIERATFVIHDLGGVVGVMAATERPERIVGLVATNSFAWPPEGTALRAMLAIVGSRTATATLGTLRLVPRLTCGKGGVGLHFDQADRRAFFGPYRRRAASRNFHRAMRSARRSRQLFADAEQRLIESFSDLPVFTVFGEKNDPFGFADRWRSMFPHARSWTVPAGNHFPMCDDPGGYATRLREWHRAEVGS